MIALNIRDRSFADLPGVLWLGQSAPLGWLVVQRLVLLVSGTGELALRAVPMLFGISTLVAAAWVGLRWMHGLSAMLLTTMIALGQWLSHYRFELKHYTADAFWALVLPALAAWALEGRGPDGRWRWTRWWAVAALAQWTANGALFVTPGCAVLLFLVILRRDGAGAAVRFAAAGLLWVMSAGAHYLLSLRHAHESRHLREYWADAVAPLQAGATEIAAWFAARVPALADNPGGSEAGVALWIAAIAGCVFSRRPVLAMLFASVPVSGFLLAAVGLVPLDDRVALWIVPALYVGVALLADTSLHALARWRAAGMIRTASAVVAAVVAIHAAVGVVDRGRRNLDLDAPSDNNHALDDRRAVAWLMARRRPGDAVLSTRLGWPAIWWYGDISLRRPAPAARLADGTVMYELTHDRSVPGCAAALDDTLRPHRRALVYVGFPDMPSGYFDLVLHQLSAVGRVVDSAEFAGLSRVAVLEVAMPGVRDPGHVSAPPPLEGCVGLRRARRW